MFAQKNQWTHLLLLVMLSVTLCLTGTLAAGKGGKKPPSDPPPAGKIFFLTDGTDGSGNPISVGGSMLADGSDKQLSELNHPSYFVHNGDRWFLDVITITVPSHTMEVIAVRESDGLAVQLTDDPDIINGVNGRAKWAKDDSFISFIGRHDADGDGVTVEESIFAADVAFTADGEPFLTAIPVAMSTFDLADNIRKFDWSPDGTAVAYSLGQQLSSNDPPPILFVQDFAADTLVMLDFGQEPEWSPDGSRIAYKRDADDSVIGIATINPDGSDYSQLTTAGRKILADEKPVWSPDGQHLAFTRVSFIKGNVAGFREDIHRISASGGSTTNLTEDVGDAYTLGWR